jgi:hypothetical protein
MDNLRRIYRHEGGYNEDHEFFSRMADIWREHPPARKSTPTELGIIRFPGRIASSVIVEGYAEDGRVREATSRRRN